MQLKKKNKITASAPSDIKRYYGLKRMQELSSRVGMYGCV
jgi:hypothetical protein